MRRKSQSEEGKECGRIARPSWKRVLQQKQWLLRFEIVISW